MSGLTVSIANVDIGYWAEDTGAEGTVLYRADGTWWRSGIQNGFGCPVEIVGRPYLSHPYVITPGGETWWMFSLCDENDGGNVVRRWLICRETEPPIECWGDWEYVANTKINAPTGFHLDSREVTS
jgi:hypothetical protein